jgi:hypothetical protein
MLDFADSNKHSSLLRYGLNCGRKKFLIVGSWSLFLTLIVVVNVG